MRHGEIRGFLNENINLGDINKNSSNGIYGKLNKENNNINARAKVPIASRNEIVIGPAKILCTVDESQQIKEYNIEILKISNSNFGNSKGMVIKVTDEELIKRTGGIIQGMSGSPVFYNFHIFLT